MQLGRIEARQRDLPEAYVHSMKKQFTMMHAWCAWCASVMYPLCRSIQAMSVSTVPTVVLLSLQLVGSGQGRIAIHAISTVNSTDPTIWQCFSFRCVNIPGPATRGCTDPSGRKRIWILFTRKQEGIINFSGLRGGRTRRT